MAAWWHYFTICLLCLVYLTSSQSEDLELEGIANEPSSRMKMTKVLIAKTKMKFLWNVPSPKPAYFIVRYNNKSVQVNDGAVQLKGLSPYTNYSVEVFACPKDAKNGCVSIIGPNMYRTKTGVPGRVKNIHLSQVNYTHVALTWDPPSEVVDSHQFYQVRAIDANTRIEVNTTRRGIHLPMPACRNGTLSTFQKVFINMVNFNNSTGAGALQYKGNSLTSIILYLDCLRALSKNTPEEVFKLSKVIVSKTWIKLWWSAPKMLKNPSHYLVMYNENIIQVKNTEVELTNLKSDTNYNIMVSACTMTGNCSLSTMPIELRTKLGIPDRVENLTVHKVNLTDGYLVSWNPPSVTNGQNLLYRVHILFVNGQQRTFDIENTSTLISVPKCNDKAPSSVEYVIKVAVVNLNDGVDELVGESENMTIFANCAVYTIQPPKLPQIEEFHIDSTSLSILCNLPSPPLKSASYYKVVINNATTPIRVEGPQVALHSLAPNTTHTVELYQCFVNCSSFFGSKTLQTKPLTPITIENLEVVDLNASHICINWMFSPTLKGLGNILYQVQLGHGQFVEEFLTNDSFVVFQKLICPSNRSDVISHHLFWVVINVTNIVDPSFVCEPKSVTLSVPCFNIYKSMFTNILLSNTSIFLQWTHVHPIGKNTNNNISYVVTYNGESKNVRNNYHMLTNLQPHTEYKIVISMCDSVCHNLTQPLVIRTNDAVGVKVENLTMKLLDASHALVSWVRSSVVDVVCNYSLKIKSSNFLFTNNLTSSTFTKVPVPTCEDTHSESYLVEVNIITTESISPSIVFQPATLTVLLQCESKKLTPTDLPVHLTRIVATTTTIDLTWNGTHPADYLVSFNDSSVHVSSTSAVLTDLTPGMEYTVKIVKCNDTTATSCNTSLVAPFSVHTNHEILRVEKVTIGSTDDSSLTISWVPAPSRSLPLRYDVSVISAINQFNASTEATFLQIPHPSCEFIETVDVHATITPYNEGEVAGAPTTAGIQLRCPHKAHLIQIDAYSHQITLSWKDPSTETGSHYVVRCVKNDTQLDATLTTTMTMATIDNLSANMTYQLQVRKCGRHNCSVLIDSFVVRTQVDAPSPSTAHLVENLTIEDINATHVCIRWSPPRAEASVADLSHASDQPMYDVRMHTNKGRTLYTSSTNYTHLYLPIPLCEDDVSSSSLEVYKIGIQVNGTCQQRGMDGHDAASSTIVLLSKCLSNFSDEQQCTTMSHWPINDVFLIAVLGSLIALLIYAAYTYKNFNYKYKPIELSNYESPHGYCVVYSTSDRESFQQAKIYLQKLWQTDSISTKAVILVGNKTDLVRIRAVSFEEGTKLATSYECKFIETSVGINHNVDELLVGILTQIRLKLDNPPDPSIPRDQYNVKKRSRSPVGNCGPRVYRGSRTSASLRVRKILSKVWSINSKSKSCENLHVL